MKTALCILICGVICSAQAQPPQKPNKDMSAFLRQLSDTSKTIADGYVRWTEAVKAGNVESWKILRDT